jgi:ribosomal protein L37E
MDAIENDDFMGFCLACGEEAYGVEPDARDYECESCGQPRVYGAGECLMMLLA